jgi:hypothetical protein
MKQILVVGCSIVLALIVMDTNVVKTSSGLSVKGTEALAADLPMPPPVVAPVGKGKAPIIGKGKGKGLIVTRG